MSLLKHRFSSALCLSGRWNNSGVWRRGAACCSACSTYHRPRMATCRARPRRGLVAGCVWGSSDVPTWLPWTSTVIQTPTLKRKEHSCITFVIIQMGKCCHTKFLQAMCTCLNNTIINPNSVVHDSFFVVFIVSMFPFPGVLNFKDFFFPSKL